MTVQAEGILLPSPQKPGKKQLHSPEERVGGKESRPLLLPAFSPPPAMSAHPLRSCLPSCRPICASLSLPTGHCRAPDLVRSAAASLVPETRCPSAGHRLPHRSRLCHTAKHCTRVFPLLLLCGSPTRGASLSSLWELTRCGGALSCSWWNGYVYRRVSCKEGALRSKRW